MTWPQEQNAETTDGPRPGRVPADSAIPAPERATRRPALGVHLLSRLLVGSYYLVLVAVLGALATAALTLLFGLSAVAALAQDMLSHPEVSPGEAKHFAVQVVELIDFLLLGIVLYVVALGLYKLFVDPALPTPDWLVVDSLDDLKESLVGVVIVLLAVTFLGAVVSWDGGASLLPLGVSVGLVLLALAVVRLTHRPERAP